MEYEFKGILLQQISKREGDGQHGHWCIATYLAVTTDEFHDRKIAVEVWDGTMGRVAQWDSMVGKKVTFQFSVDAREYNGRWYNTLNAFGLRRVDEPKQGQTPQPPQPPQTPQEPQPQAQPQQAAPAQQEFTLDDNAGLPF